MISESGVMSVSLDVAFIRREVPSLLHAPSVSTGLTRSILPPSVCHLLENVVRQKPKFEVCLCKCISV